MPSKEEAEDSSTFSTSQPAFNHSAIIKEMEGSPVCHFKGLSHSVHLKGWTSKRIAWPKYRQASPHPVPGYCDSCSEVPGGAQPGSGVSGLPQGWGAFALGAAETGDIAFSSSLGPASRISLWRDHSIASCQWVTEGWHPGAEVAQEATLLVKAVRLWHLFAYSLFFFPFLRSLRELVVSQPLRHGVLRTAMPGCWGTTKDNSAPAGDTKWALGFLELAERCCQKQHACESPGGISVSETVAFSIFLIKKKYTWRK